jgi:phospholipid/cholesterol/gamma-HCH transport system substrate-binding protein
MNKSRLEIKVGLFVFVCLALLAAMMVQFNKGGSLLNDSYTLKLHAVNVGGLKHEAQVLLAGYQVGNVRDIQLADDGKSVTIYLKINKKYQIYHDARFVIEQAGFLGDEYISVIPTENQDPKFADGADVPCQEPFDLQEVARGAAGFIKRMDETAKKLDDSVSDLRAQVLNAQTLSTFGVALTNMQKFTQQALGTIDGINAIVATNGSQISAAVSNFVYFSGEASQLGASAQGILATNSMRLNDAMQNLDDASTSLKQIAADVQAGHGLAGTVLQNQELATNVQLIAANLAVTTSNLNRTGLWGILWSHKTPATNQPAATKK